MSLSCVLAGSPSCGLDVVVYGFDINQVSLPTPFYSVLASISVFMALSTVFLSINFPDNSPFSHFVLAVLFLALLVLSALCLFLKVSFSPDISVFKAVSTVFLLMNSPDSSPLSHSAPPVIFLPYWSFQLYISL